MTAYVWVARCTRGERTALGLNDELIVSADDSAAGAPTLRSTRYGLVGRLDQLVRVGRMLIPVEQKPSARRITLHNQLIGLALMLVAVVRAWTDFDQSNWLTWVFVSGIAAMFLGLLALDVAMDSRFRAYKRMMATAL
jgi:hypothetical protein